MPFAVVQSSLDPPTLAQLQAAFRGVPGLTPLDAHALGRDAFGIIVKDLSAEAAGQLQSNLRVQGYKTLVVDERELPAMPAAKFVRRLDVAPDALIVYDPVGRNFPVQWGHVSMLAAGQVRLSDFKRIVTERPTARFAGDATPYVDYECEVTYKEEMQSHLLVEIFLGQTAQQRLSLRADEFNFATLREELTQNPAENFQRLVRVLLKHAPHAIINRGAYYLREEPPTVFDYPSKNAFYEEITWLLWRARQAPDPPG